MQTESEAPDGGQAVTRAHEGKDDTVASARPALASEWPRIIVLIAFVVAASVTGVGLVFEFGEHLRSSDTSVENTAYIRRVPLPNGVRDRQDVTSFELEVDGADDFARVYVNNYLVFDSEADRSLFYIDQGDAGNTYSEVYSRVRNLSGENSRDLKFYLRDGWNHVIYELENSRFGACMGSFGLRMNGEPLRGLPVTVRYEDMEFFSNEQLRQREPGSYHLDAICGRWVWSFYLQH